MAELLFGTSIKRREDPRFITARARTSMTSAFPAPPMPHSSAAARARAHRPHQPRAGENSSPSSRRTRERTWFRADEAIPTGWLIPNMKIPAHYPLAVDRARYMGDAVAVVIAESPYVARDAAELVEVDYEPLPAVADRPRRSSGALRRSTTKPRTTSASAGSSATRQPPTRRSRARESGEAELPQPSPHSERHRAPFCLASANPAPARSRSG